MRSTTAMLILTVWAGLAAAQAPRFPEAVTVDVDAQVEKKLGAVRDFVAAEEWEQAVDLLREIGTRPERRLVRFETGRYVDTWLQTQLILAGFPPEGLAVYRRDADPVARTWFERGRSERDVRRLERVVREAFASSFGDDASLLLGDLAFERGDFAAARTHWTRLAPLPEPVPPGDPLPRLRHPDPDVPLPSVLARLVLASIVEGDHDRVRHELESFTERFPDAEGTLGSRTGHLADLLADLAAEARTWPGRRESSPATTFGGTASRQASETLPVPVGAPHWSIALPERDLPRPARSTGGFPPRTPRFHPLVWRNAVLLADGDRVLAYDLRTGDAWPDPRDTPVLYHRGRTTPRPERPVAGTPWQTLTLDDGVLYARLGSPVTTAAEKELRDTSSEIVALDLAHGEGDLLARIAAEEVAGGEEGWRFEGTPVAKDGRLYVALRRAAPQVQVHLAALALEPVGRRDHGFRVVWNQPIVAALEQAEEARNATTHLLPAVDADHVYLSTDFGAVAAVDRDDGHVRWLVTYPQADEDDASDPRATPLLPPVVVDGTVFIAPADARDVTALDAGTGDRLWRTPLPDRLRHVLGVGHGNLIVGGDSLWALDVHTGRIAWAKRRGDPEHFGHGRGLLAGEWVWWPQREGIAVVHQRTGRPAAGDPVPHWIDLRHRGVRGGNLLIAHGRLIVAGHDRLTVFSPTGRTLDDPDTISLFRSPREERVPSRRPRLPVGLPFRGRRS